MGHSVSATDGESVNEMVADIAGAAKWALQSGTEGEPPGEAVGATVCSTLCYAGKLQILKR